MDERTTTTVYADGVYDMLHCGHLAFFEKARALGDRLVIGVLSDENVSTYKPRPVIPHDERVAMLRACRLVDGVIEDAPMSVDRSFLRQHQIDLVVHGDDKAFEDYYALPIALGIMRYVPYSPISSSSSIRERLAAGDPPGRVT